MTRTLLLDSDIIAFKVAASAETKTKFGVVREPLHVAKANIDTTIDGLMKLLKADEVVVCLSCREHNWRNDVLPSYKDNRDHAERPLYLQDLKDYMADNYVSYLRHGLEADDVMGILSTTPKLFPGEKIIVSEDKDMRTVPGKLYAPHRHELGIIDITPLQALQFHMWQTICGDVTDGYKGVPGLGKGSVFATEIVEEDEDELWDTVLLAFGSKGLTEDDALVQARVAKILTREWYDFEKKEVKLWTPKEI